MELRKAQKKKAKLRIGLSGPPGSGKTYSALLLASGLAPWEKICVIDTENGSGDLYDSLGEYNVIPLEAPFTPERYIEAINTAEEAGMEVIIVDSITHEWDGSGGCLEINERVANTKFRGNTHTAWSETGKRHQNFIYAITQSKTHVITTVRTKVQYALVEENGKKTVQKVGTKEITRDGYEYELTANFLLYPVGNFATVSKDRTGIFLNRDPFLITAETGKEFKDWAELGVEPPRQKTAPEMITEVEYALSMEQLQKLFKEYQFKVSGDDVEKLVEAKDKAKERLQS
jgi:hypothetical protein